MEISRFIWILVWLLVSYLGKTINAACPVKCVCESGYIDCSDAGLDIIPWDLPDPVGLRTLRLQGNRIHELVAEIVSYANLQELDLSNNRMHSIEDTVFQSLVNLKTLRLTDNRLETITSQTFKGLKSLQTLDLSDNNLRNIQDSPFTDMQNLQELDLSRNSLEAVSSIALLGLVNLRSLSLSSNELQEVPRDSLSHASSIHYLMLNENNIKEIPAGTFADSKALQKLNLDGNRIKTISGAAFGDKYDNDIRFLSLRNNDLSRIPIEAISHLKMVQTIDLSGNPIVVVDPDAFKGLQGLESTSLESMPELEVLRSYSFSELESLKSVSLHSNSKLRSIESEAFLASENIKLLDLHNTGLTTLDSGLLKWENLEHLDLRFNKWNCDCHLGFLPGVLQSLRNRTLASQVFCAEPRHLESRAIFELSADHFQCDVEVQKLKEEVLEERIVIGIIAGASCLVLVVMIILMYRSRYTMFGMGQVPVRYRVQRSTLGNGHVVRGREEDNNSDDGLTMTDNEEQQPQSHHEEQHRNEPEVQEV